jgi:hypothetical protein
VASVDKFNGEELAAIFQEVVDTFTTDLPNALLLTRQEGGRNLYDEPTSGIIDSPNDLHIIVIGNPDKEIFTTAGAHATSRTWFITDAATANMIDIGDKVQYRNKIFIVRVWEVKEIRGVDLIGYGMMERVPS